MLVFNQVKFIYMYLWEYYLCNKVKMLVFNQMEMYLYVCIYDNFNQVEMCLYVFMRILFQYFRWRCISMYVFMTILIRWKCIYMY